MEYTQEGLFLTVHVFVHISRSIYVVLLFKTVSVLSFGKYIHLS